MKKKKLVFIGNSIVNGFPLKRRDCFVSLIRRDTGWDVINKGVNGETTPGIMARFDRDVIAHEPDMVFILTGTNDFIYGQASPEEVFTNLQTLAEKAHRPDLRDTPTPMAPITPVLMTPVPIHAEMASRLWMAGAGVDYDKVNESLERLAVLIRGAGYACIDLLSTYKACGQYHDGVHPTAEGHRFIADRIRAFFHETES